jgi:hypothetical protein
MQSSWVPRRSLGLTTCDSVTGHRSLGPLCVAISAQTNLRVTGSSHTPMHAMASCVEEPLRQQPDQSPGEEHRQNISAAGCTEDPNQRPPASAADAADDGAAAGAMTSQEASTAGRHCAGRWDGAHCARCRDWTCGQDLVWESTRFERTWHWERHIRRAAVRDSVAEDILWFPWCGSCWRDEVGFNPALMDI